MVGCVGAFLDEVLKMVKKTKDVLSLEKEISLKEIELNKLRQSYKEHQQARNYSVFREQPIAEREKASKLQGEIWELEEQLSELNRKLTANPELEARFKAAFEEASAEIKKHLTDAREALSNAIKVSKETGIPFSSGVVFNRDTYVPNTMKDKWKDLSNEFISEFSEENDFHIDSIEGYGWATSYC